MSANASGHLLELDNRKRIPLGKIAQHDRYRARLMPNGSILLEPVVVISTAEAAVLADPEFVAMIQQRVKDTQAGHVDRGWDELRAAVADIPDDDEDLGEEAWASHD